MKWTNLLAVIFSLCFVSVSGIGCAPITSGWYTYDNSVYGYSISCPAGWKVDDIDIKSVRIYLPSTSAKLTISVDYFNYQESLRSRVLYKETLITGPLCNGELLSSMDPRFIWDWCVTYSFPSEGEKFYGQTCYLDSDYHAYKVTWGVSTESFLHTECLDISKTFRLH